jgi:16S rRNA C1402 (ribose-2'-O) methylase RsmI
LFIETPYRSQMVLEVALETLSADTFFGVTQDLSGDHQRILVQQVKHWKSTHPLTLAKAPAVFLLGNPQINK